MASNKATIGGSLSDREFQKALTFYNIYGDVMRSRNKYEKIAQLLAITPTRSNSKKLLKVGSPAYKASLQNEVMRRYKIARKNLDKIQNQALTEIKQRTVELRKTPKVTSKTRIDKSGGFALFNYELEGVTDLTQLYVIIKRAMENLGDLNFVTLMFQSNATGKVRGMSLKADHLQTFEEFNERVQSLINGEVAGSDAYTLDEYTLLFSNIHIATYSLARAHGNSNSQLFKHIKVDGGKYNDCVYQCLERFGCKVNKRTTPNLHLISELVKHIKINNLPIAILANSFHLTTGAQRIVDKNGKTKFSFENKKKKRTDFKYGSVLKQDTDIDLCYVYNPNDGLEEDAPKMEIKHTLLYDELNNHVDILDGEPTLMDNIFLSVCGEVMRYEKDTLTVLFTPKQVLKNTAKPTKGGFKYLFFDYETVIDFSRSSCMLPYSLSILELTEGELKTLGMADEANQEIIEDPIYEEGITGVQKVEQIRKNNCHTFMGYDCNEKFIRWFCEAQQNQTFCFVGFNNVNFDNFILLDALLRFNQHESRVCYNVNNIFYNGSQLLNFAINGRHSTFDIHKHLTMGSLADNCKGFKVNCCAKKSFDHALAQRLHEEGKLIEYINTNEELQTYNEFDVLATAVLFFKYRENLKNIPCVEKYALKLKESTTIGSLIYSAFTDHIKQDLKNTNEELRFNNKKELDRYFGKLSYKHYKDLQKYKIAGRVELFNGVKKLNERMASTDVCSLYPYVMAIHNCYYPCGEIIEVDTYKGDDEIGFYYCDIDQSNLKAQNLPKIYAEKKPLENNWDHNVVLNDYLISNVMIGLLRQYGCDVVVKKGFIFSGKRKSFEMFGFLLDLMQAKNEQDEFKANNDPRYNSALRETLKLLMNSLSGKVIEALHTEMTTAFNNESEFLKIQDKADSINFINCIGSKLFATYTVDEESICEAKQRPIFLGVLIYDYAKRYMYQNSYSKIGLDKLLYTDTDASKFPYSEMARWRDWIESNNVIVPHWREVEAYDRRYRTHLIYEPNSKVFGSFEDELEEMQGDEYAFYCVEKKSWCYKAGNQTKFKFKGINPKAIVVGAGELPFLKKKDVRNPKTKEIESVFKLEPNTQDQVYEYCENNKHLTLKNNAVEFFDKLYNTGEGYVFTNSFRRIVKNSLRSVELGDDDKYNGLMNSIQVNYTLKRVKIDLTKKDLDLSR
jgi:hypothetical protein